MRIIETLARSVMVAALAMAGVALHAQEGVSKTSVVLGQSIALTGPGSALAVPFHQGAKMYFDRLNAAGGVNGRKIELVTLDDRGNAQIATENTKKLLDQGVLSLFGFYGSPQVTAIYPQIKDSDVLLFAPMAAADEFRGAMYANVYSLRPGYAEEAAAIARHAETLGARRLGILHATDGESMAALDSAVRTMSSIGSNVVANAAVTSGSVANSVDKVLAAKPESVLVIGDANGAASAVRDLRAKGFRGPIYGFSNTGESLLAEELGPAGAGVVVVRVVPKSDTAKVAVVREMMADAQAAKLGKPNVYMLEGYIAARVYAEALRRDPARGTQPRQVQEVAGSAGRRQRRRLSRPLRRRPRRVETGRAEPDRLARQGQGVAAPANRRANQPISRTAASPRMKASQRASWSRATYSSGWCACVMLPGPHTTVGMPEPLNRPASVPKATSVVRCSPDSRWARRVTASSAEPRKLGISQIVSKRNPASGAMAFIAGSSDFACATSACCIARASAVGRSRNS